MCLQRDPRKNLLRLGLVLVFVAIVVTSAAALSAATHGGRRTTADAPHPVILVPGDGGSQLEAKLDKPSVVHYICDKKTNDYFDIWLNLELLVPLVLDCWVDNIRLEYDNATRTTRSPPGVDVRVPGFGNTSTVEWLDPSRISPSAYFTNIVEMLIAAGYNRTKNIRGAPYDYRKAPNELPDYFKQLLDMIEETYNQNGGKRVILVCHSMGCMMSHYLMNHQKQAWKDKYIRSLVTLGAPWGGAVKAMKAFASGENLGVFVINSLTVRAEQRSCPSLAYLLPTDKFWSKDEVLVYGPTRNYTVADYHQFFNDIDYMDGWEMWQDTHLLNYDLIPPGVEVHCLHGVNVSTIDGLVYGKGFPDVQPKLITGNGDGTVNIRSLEGCLQWQGKQKQKIYHKYFKNIDHMGVLYDPDVIAYIKSLALSD